MSHFDYSKNQAAFLNILLATFITIYHEEYFVTVQRYVLANYLFDIG